MIRFDAVGFRHPDSDSGTVRDIDCLLQPGEYISVLGANGSGKTTFLKLAAGLLTPTTGRITRRPTGAGVLAVGMVTQDPDDQLIMPIVRDDLLFSPAYLGWTEDRAVSALERVTKEFGLKLLVGRPVHELSAGERTRLALAGALIAEPGLLILDEPESFLDASNKSALVDAIATVRRTSPSTTILHATQNIALAEKSGRALVFAGGAIVHDGSFGQALSRLRPEAAPDAVSRELASALACKHSGGHQKTLQVDALTYWYQPDAPVLRDVSFSTRQGEVLAVTGPSGSGKSTLGKLLAGLLKPVSGHVRELETGVTVNAAMLLEGASKQFFLPTCREELAFTPGTGREVPSDALIESWLAILGLPAAQFAHRDPWTLSGGEQRRLALGLLFRLESPWVVLDEPGAGLDGDGRARLISLISALASSGYGVMIISHDQSLVARSAHQVLELGCGERPTLRKNGSRQD